MVHNNHISYHTKHFPPIPNQLTKTGYIMGKLYNELDDNLISFIGDQKIFFISTAPDEGRINLSPKGMDTFSVIGKNVVAFLNLTGSGNETAAHLKINPRITVMFCSFSKTPLILRLYGKGSVIQPGDNAWNNWLSRFKDYPGARQVVTIEIESIQTSCGFAVPLAETIIERGTLQKWADNKGEEGVKEYWKEKNQTSLDGYPTYILDKDN